MVFVGALLVTLSGTLRITHPAFQGCGLGRLTRVGKESQNEQGYERNRDSSLHHFLHLRQRNQDLTCQEGPEGWHPAPERERSNWSQEIQSAHDSEPSGY